MKVVRGMDHQASRRMMKSTSMTWHSFMFILATMKFLLPLSCAGFLPSPAHPHATFLPLFV